MKIVNSRSKG